MPTSGLPLSGLPSQRPPRQCRPWPGSKVPAECRLAGCVDEPQLVDAVAGRCGEPGCSPGTPRQPGAGRDDHRAPLTAAGDGHRCTDWASAAVITEATAWAFAVSVGCCSLLRARTSATDSPTATTASTAAAAVTSSQVVRSSVDASGSRRRPAARSCRVRSTSAMTRVLSNAAGGSTDFRRGEPGSRCRAVSRTSAVQSAQPSRWASKSLALRPGRGHPRRTRRSAGGWTRSCRHPHHVAQPDKSVPAASSSRYRAARRAASRPPPGYGRRSRRACTASRWSSVSEPRARLYLLPLEALPRRPRRPGRMARHCARAVPLCCHGRSRLARSEHGRRRGGAPWSAPRWRRRLLAGSNRPAVRHTSTRTSWVTSSDCAWSRSTRRTTPSTDPAIRP